MVISRYKIRQSAVHLHCRTSTSGRRARTYHTIALTNGYTAFSTFLGSLCFLIRCRWADSIIENCRRDRAKCRRTSAKNDWLRMVTLSPSFSSAARHKRNVSHSRATCSANWARLGSFFPNNSGWMTSVMGQGLKWQNREHTEKNVRHCKLCANCTFFNQNLTKIWY